MKKIILPDNPLRGTEIHGLDDAVRDPAVIALAGAWRGPFGHKNGAGAMMVVLIFVGIFVGRTVNWMAGLIITAGAAVFLDLKFHDIPNTVAKAVAAATRLDVQMLTIHTGGGREMMQAALASAERGREMRLRMFTKTPMFTCT
jgi:hypothetical protein